MKRTTTRNFTFRDEPESENPFLVGLKFGVVLLSHEMGLNIELTPQQAESLARDILKRIDEIERRRFCR